MTATTETNMETTQVYRVYIKATPQAIWDAITKPEWTPEVRLRRQRRLRPARRAARSAPTASQEMRDDGRPGPRVDGEVIEADPPRRLVLTWRMVMDEAMAAEGFTRLTYEIEESQEGVSKLTLTHELEGAPKLAGLMDGDMEADGAGGGWAWVLSDLKTLLETGKGFWS